MLSIAHLFVQDHELDLRARELHAVDKMTMTRRVLESKMTVRGMRRAENSLARTPHASSK
jgi:hypothetical protein